MTDAKDAARRRFDRWAARYETDQRSIANLGPQQDGLTSLRLAADDRFLDVGCGSGSAVRKAATIAQRAVGVDLAPAMIERARQLAAGLATVEFIVGDSDHLPFPDESFTALLCSSSLHHYPDPTRALAEMARVLALGGRLAIAEPDGELALVRIADRLLRRLDRSHVHIHRATELTVMARTAGFTDVTTRPLGKRGYLLLNAHRN